MIIAQCATAPYIIDNESYYIQTIKWLNEYGFVKGLANLHIFFSQTSGWHIAQSAFNFSFLYSGFNDLSGYCLLLGNIFCIIKLNEYFNNKNFEALVIGLLPLANVLLFQFISAPSPDLPVYIFTFIAVYYFLDKENSAENFKIVTLLSVFIVYIKITAIAIILLPVAMLVLHFKYIRSSLVKIAIPCLMVTTLFLYKNYLLSGYVLFPNADFSILKPDWKLPLNIARHYGFSLFSGNQSLAHGQSFTNWLFMPKLDGIFNKLAMIIIIISPLVIYKFKNKNKWWILYSIMVLQLILLLQISPQYRFYLNFLLLFLFLAVSVILQNKKVMLLSFTISALATAFVLLIPLKLNKVSDNKYTSATSNFNIKNSIFPHKNSKYNLRYSKVSEGNLEYNSPEDIDFFWGCGDGPLPCVNKKQIIYFNHKYNIIPQLRGNTLKEGFYAKDTGQ
ncbi:hypothetical protein ABS766_06135 [Flavobacterium sp. ST-119]|uniref:DUF8201 domain-containing protein n=2 Tax=Flavobacterium rhizosphaerae TaxID=3163298 RepID=A0ABW8YWZ9_9FLAO